MNDVIRLQQANAILGAFAPGCSLDIGRNGLVFCWPDHDDKPRRGRWVVKSRGSDYPTISDRVPFGGTRTVATTELTRFVRGLPVRPLGMWEYMCSPTVGMTPKALELAVAAGWPERVPCVFCGRLVGGEVGWNHYDLKGWPVGPGCFPTEGCRGRPPAQPAAGTGSAATAG